MSLSRRVKTDVQSAIQTKDDELGKMVAMMDEEELRALADFGPTGMEDINLWKRDRRKRSWRRLSAFGLVRDDPLLYRQWKEQRDRRLKVQAEDGKVGSPEPDEMLGTTCTSGRRPPWSTDLHYTHRYRQQRQRSPRNTLGEQDVQDEEEQQPQQDTHTAEDLVSDTGTVTIKGTRRLGRIRRKCVHTAPSARKSATVVLRTRPASAPLGAGERPTPRPPDHPKTARTPSLARLAQVFYQSSMRRTASESSQWSSERRHPACPARGTRKSPENAKLKLSCRSESCEDEMDESGSRIVSVDSAQRKATETHCPEKSKSKKKPDLSGAEKRMEGVRLLWAVSQLSAEAVTKKIMHGYSERQRAREPNRPRWMMPSRRPQPSTSRRSAKTANRRREQG